MSARGPTRLAILVHELRSPVAALAAIGEAFRDESLERSARRELAALAAAACRGIERIVGDVAVASVCPVDFDVVRVVHATAAAAALGGARVRVDSEPELPPVTADPLRVRQALDNLVSNAVAYSPPGTEVTLGVRMAGDTTLISVSDRGPGIPAEERERIFERGVRLDAGRPGSGLGLSIVRAIAEAHGGMVTVESEPGEGAIFTLVLPRHHAQPAT